MVTFNTTKCATILFKHRLQINVIPGQAQRSYPSSHTYQYMNSLGPLFIIQCNYFKKPFMYSMCVGSVPYNNVIMLQYYSVYL